MIGTGEGGGEEEANGFVSWGEIAGLGSDIDDGELCSSLDGDLPGSRRGEMTGAGGRGFSLEVAVVLDEDETGSSSGAFDSAEWSIFDLEKNSDLFFASNMHVHPHLWACPRGFDFP